MPEPTLQVPVSLIERIRDQYHGTPLRPGTMLRELVDLLSQPTPTDDTIVIDDPVAGRIEQHVRRRTRPPQPAMLLGHDFLPVAGHPDDDECTYRTDGTDATYCGATLAEHLGATQAQVDHWLVLAKRYPPSKPAEPLRIEDMAPGTTFTEEVRWAVTGTLSTGAVVAHSASGEMRFTDRFDPSTIRDVQPPNDAA